MGRPEVCERSAVGNGMTKSSPLLATLPVLSPPTVFPFAITAISRPGPDSRHRLPRLSHAAGNHCRGRIFSLADSGHRSSLNPAGHALRCPRQTTRSAVPNRAPTRSQGTSPKGSHYAIPRTHPRAAHCAVCRPLHHGPAAQHSCSRRSGLPGMRPHHELSPGSPPPQTASGSAGPHSVSHCLRSLLLRSTAVPSACTVSIRFIGGQSKSLILERLIVFAPDVSRSDAWKHDAASDNLW
ncbi:MAG: hypothetical protein JWO87_3230 [Phycisphaerales bacterium]|nr:hypothetical protein [Phycisphaerales bacterium]